MMLPMLIDLGWKSALIAAAVLLADWVMRGRPAAERVFVLRIGVAALLTLPAAMMWLPPVDLALLPAPEAATVVAQAPMAAVAMPATPAVAEAPIDLAGLLYALGAGGVLLHLAIGIAVLARWTRRGVEMDQPGWQAALARGTADLRRPVKLLVSDDIATPISWGIAPAWVLVDRTTLARPAQADAVIAHEMAHIRRFDWPMLIAARIAVALLWFNPLVWILSRTLARRGETAADEAAVRGIERADYAEALLSFAAAPAARGMATGMALWPNALAERITHIAMHRHRRGSRVIPAMALICTAIAAPVLAAARLVPAEPRGAAPSAPVVTPARERAPASPVARSAVERRAGVAIEPRNAPAASVLPVERQAVAAPASAPVAGAANAPQPPLRIVGQTGAGVVRTADGVTITAPQPLPRPLPLPLPPQNEETPDWAKHAANELSQAAREIRAGARNVELTAELPGVDAEERADIAKQVREMRAQADEFEARARALRGPGG